LKAGRDKSLRRRHPWVFSGAVERIEGEPKAGATVCVLSYSGEFIAHAAYSPQSQIRLRVWSFDENAVIDAAFFEQRLTLAIDARRSLGVLDEEGACRVVFAEADGLPGLVVDRYGSYLVCQFLSAGIEPWREAVIGGLATLLRPLGIYERSESSARRKEGLPSSRGLLYGSAPPPRLELNTDGLRQTVDIVQGQKTGAYLDQRDNRRRVTHYANGARVSRQDFVCQHAFSYPTVLADGTLVACEQDYNGTQPYGRLSSADSFRDLWFSPRAARIRRIIRDDPPQFSFCRNCPYADRPTSSCSVAAYRLESDGRAARDAQ